VTGLIAAAVVGYLLGSIPSGLLIGRWLAGVDIRQYGSGRTGATNAMRSLGARGFALTFAADAGKAIVAVLIARALVGEAPGPLVAEAVAAVAAIVGPNWSIYIGFHGGRGVATSFGAMLMLYWPGALIGLVAAGILMGTTRYVSLGSLGGTIVGLAVAAGAVLTGAQPPVLAEFALAVAALVVWQHRDNIQRLLAGTERRIGQRTEPRPGGSRPA
jgi:glycerol-3-phosphate acyltransferase PlsY